MRCWDSGSMWESEVKAECGRRGAGIRMNLPTLTNTWRQLFSTICSIGSEIISPYHPLTLPIRPPPSRTLIQRARTTSCCSEPNPSPAIFSFADPSIPPSHNSSHNDFNSHIAQLFSNALLRFSQQKYTLGPAPVPQSQLPPYGTAPDAMCNKPSVSLSLSRFLFVREALLLL